MVVVVSVVGLIVGDSVAIQHVDYPCVISEVGLGSRRPVIVARPHINKALQIKPGSKTRLSCMNYAFYLIDIGEMPVCISKITV